VEPILNNFERITEYSILVALLGAISLAVADMLLSGFLPEKWFVVGIFSFLFSISVFSMKIPEMSRRIRLIENKINVRGFEKFSNHKTFYEALEISVKNAKNELLLSHIRDEPPSSYRGGKNYFSYVENWANSRPEGIVKRIGAYGNPAMKSWADSQHEASQSIPNYYFRVVPWTMKFPFLNMAIIDRQEVFIAISTGEAEGTKALKFNDAETAAYLTEYFSHVWNHSAPHAGDSE